MKTLFIARHAKSSWDDIRISDHDRDLLTTGIERTVKVATFLKSKNVIPDLIISSSAVRALKTARLLAEGMGYNMKKIKISPSLYNCDEDDVFDELYDLSGNIQSVMVVGHNPTFTDFSNYFIKKKYRIDNLPTSGVIAIKIKTKKWKKILDAKYTLDFKIFPRMLRF